MSASPEGSERRQADRPNDFAARFNPKVAEAIKVATAAGGYGALLGMRVDRVEPGVVVCSLPVRPELHSGVGAVHGGAIASLIDHTLSLAVYPLVEPGRWVATTEFKLNYTGSVKDGTITATGRVVSLRKRLAVCQVEVENDGRPVAIAQGTLYVRDLPGGGGA